MFTGILAMLLHLVASFTLETLEIDDGFGDFLGFFTDTRGAIAIGQFALKVI